MRRLILLISVFIVTSPIFAQFNYSHGTIENEKGYSVRTTPNDTGYIISGEIYDGPINSRDAFLVKTNPLGYIVWQYQYGWKKDEVFNSVRWNKSVPRQGFFCLGTTNSVGAGTNDILFMRINPDGIPISVKTYGGPLGDEGHCIQVIWDSEVNNWGLIMVGETDNADSTIAMQVLKTNLNGVVNNSVVISNPGAQKGYWIEQTSDSGFIAVGSSSYGCEWENQSGNDDIFVVKLNPDLSVNWAKTYGGSESVYKDDIAYSVKEIDDGYIVTGRSESYGINNLNDVFVMKIGYGGSCLRFNTYGLEDNDEGFDILYTGDLGYDYEEIITGYVTIDSVKYALLFTIDNSGNIQWAKKYGLGSVDVGYELDYIPEGFVFAGAENSFGVGLFDIYHVEVSPSGYSNCTLCENQFNMEMNEYEPCVIEDFYTLDFDTIMSHNIGVDSQQFATVECGVGIKLAKNQSVSRVQESESEFSIYPNPVGDKLIVNIPDEYLGGVLRIYNVNGQILYEDIINENILSGIEIKDYMKGIYFLSIATNKSTKNFKFLKE